MENNKIDVICEKIFRRGISIGCNKMLKSIIKDYLNGNGENELKENLKNYAGLINRVYGTFKDIKTRASKKISPYFGRHYTELIENYNFTEGIIRYSLIINGSLEKKMFELVNSISEEQKSILKRKYKKEKKVDIHEILKEVKAGQDKLYEKFDEKFVTKEGQYWVVKTIVFTGAGIILISVFTALVYLVIK